MRYQWGRLAAASIFSVMTEFVRFGRNDLLDVRLQRLEDYWYFLNESEGVRVQPKKWPQGVDCLTRPLLTDVASLRERISSVVRAERIEQVVQMRRWLLNDAAYLILRLDAPEGSPQVTIT
jgi:hypothetical protein